MNSSMKRFGSVHTQPEIVSQRNEAFHTNSYLWWNGFKVSSCRCFGKRAVTLPLCRCFVAFTLATSFYCLRHTVRNWPSQKAYSHSYHQKAWFYDSLKYVQRRQKTFRTGGSCGWHRICFLPGLQAMEKVSRFLAKTSWCQGLPRLYNYPITAQTILEP